MNQSNEDSEHNILELTARIVASYVGANQIEVEAVAPLITQVKRALNGGVQTITEKPNDKIKPAVSVAKSVTDDYIICLEDGKKLKMLKRYLRSTYNMTPEEYRKRWGLPPEYPMVAPNYAQRRSDFAKQIGLGRGVRGR